MTNNINTILALKIILKSKLKGSDIKINKMNGIMISKQDSNLNSNNKNKILKTNTNTESVPESKIEKKINYLKNSTDFKIQQVQQNNFKIIQKNIISGINENLVQYSNNSQIYYQETNQQSTFYLLPNKSNKTNQTNHTNQNSHYEQNQWSFNQQNNTTNNKKTLDEKINNMVVINSSEFDIDSIINSYSLKKNQGFVK